MSNGDNAAMASMDIIGITATKAVEQPQLQAYYVIYAQCTILSLILQQDLEKHVFWGMKKLVQLKIVDIIGITATKAVKEQQLQAYYVIYAQCTILFILSLTNDYALKKVLQEG